MSPTPPFELGDELGLLREMKLRRMCTDTYFGRHRLINVYCCDLLSKVMMLLIPLATTFFLMMLFVMGKALRNIHDHSVPAEIVSQDSVAARYRPMLWLLDEADCRSIAAVFPGNSQLRRIRSERRSLFRIYLRNLGADHARIVAGIREALVESERDLPDLAKALYRCRVKFFWAMTLIEFKLQLHALRIGTVDARGLVAAVDGLQLQLQDLVFVQAVGRA
jgi:hypothetical protein